MLDPEDLFGALDRQLLDLVDDLIALVVALPGVPSLYLLARTVPLASRTDAEQ